MIERTWRVRRCVSVGRLEQILAEDVEFYFYANCTSCRKADAFLRSEGIAAKRRDFFKHKLSASELRLLFERAGVTVREALSTRSRPYLDLGLGEKTLSDGEIIDLMAEHPALLRRPLLLSREGTLTGFNQAAYEELAVKLGKDA